MWSKRSFLFQLYAANLSVVCYLSLSFRRRLCWDLFLNYSLSTPNINLEGPSWKIIVWHSLLPLWSSGYPYCLHPGYHGSGDVDWLLPEAGMCLCDLCKCRGQMSTCWSSWVSGIRYQGQDVMDLLQEEELLPPERETREMQTQIHQEGLLNIWCIEILEYMNVTKVKFFISNTSIIWVSWPHTWDTWCRLSCPWLPPCPAPPSGQTSLCRSAMATDDTEEVMRNCHRMMTKWHRMSVGEQWTSWELRLDILWTQNICRCKCMLLTSHL